MVEAVGTSVVQIQVKPDARVQQMAGPMPFGRDGAGNDSEFADRLGELFGFDRGGPLGAPQPQAPSRSALGSGFIVDASGLVITNNHVVEGADRVTVQMSDGRELPGRVLGRDPKIDIAVIRIDAKGTFKPINWGDSDHIRVGDSVFAVGSPFGLGNTVTSGIVSARGREIGAGPYDDFLQVDAAINSGNSGGPLFDGSGRVVGVNTAIFSPSGGNVGIGFAIPAKMARQVALEIARDGHVSRGRIGVSLQDVTPDIANALGLDGTKGALIAAVEQAGPAARSGLQRGDVIRRFGSTKIDDGRDLARAVADAAIGSSVPVRVIRDGRQVALNLYISSDQAAQS
ncbi:trypsin-like peptidase domain-containing protein [Sphingomonas sp. S1-29]|uniref:trypsin-like peptidase domain-containing protein n=1 Tax=Sphingomonas sp. S1-29 TaxID=2991074 RepID=UPI0022406EEF|nr:trypsin-like peptidase domain-containing protein [Sphingomonas sp. S1-29]UZK68839.1 trypsin-like peptidase domain-containing protein [Sphingomonas sp. S1-29]